MTLRQVDAALGAKLFQIKDAEGNLENYVIHRPVGNRIAIFHLGKLTIAEARTKLRDNFSQIVALNESLEKAA